MLANYHPPINRLPPEILDAIFALSTDMPSDPPDILSVDFPTKYAHRRLGRFSSMHSWLRYKNVCRHWRAVIMSPSVRWAYVDVIPRRFRANETNLPQWCIENSAGRLLEVRIESYEHTQWISNTINENASRLKVLILAELVRGTLNLATFTQPAPNLETLVIRGHHAWGDSYGDVPNLSPRNLPILFDGHLPRLRYLEVRYFIPWPAQHLTQLTHLSLHPCQVMAPYMSPEFIEFLSQNQNLEELTLIFVRPRHDRPPHAVSLNPVRRASLPNLRRLIFYACHVNTATHLFAHLERSPLLQLVAFDSSVGENAIPLTGPPRFSGATVEFLKKVTGLALFGRIGAPEHAIVRLFGWSEDKVTFDLHPGVTTNGPENIEGCCQIISACDIRVLLLGQAAEDALSEDVWRSLFRSMPLLQKIIIRYPDVLDYDITCLNALLCAPEETDEDESDHVSEVLCHKLDEIVLYDAPLDDLQDFFFSDEIEHGLNMRRSLLGRRVNLTCVLELDDLLTHTNAESIVAELREKIDCCNVECELGVTDIPHAWNRVKSLDDMWRRFRTLHTPG